MTLRLLVLLVAALGLSTATLAEPGRSPASPLPSKPADTKPASLPPPIVFFVAKGEPNACGPGCQEWIVADGTIDPGADGRLRALLKKLGGRKLPIFFHSPGGSVQAGLAIGRLMRQHGLTAGVASTVLQGCDPQQLREEACDRLKRSGRDLPAELDFGRTMCNSSCVYALLGAAVREVGAGVRLGVHSSSISFSLRRTDREGHVTRVPTRVSPQVMTTAMQAGYDRIAIYLREMGIGGDLLATAREVRSDRLHYLSRDEVVAFGIDRRDYIEGAWLLLDRSKGAAAIKIIESKDPGAGVFHKAYVRLSCASSGTIRFQYLRELGDDRASLQLPLRVKVSGKNFPLPSGTALPQGADKPPVEVRGIDLPLSALEDAVLTVEMIEPSGSKSSSDPAAPDRRFAKLSAQTSGPSLEALRRRCNSAPSIFDPSLPSTRI